MQIENNKMSIKKLSFLLLFLSFIYMDVAAQITDKAATAETKNLYKNLKKLVGKGIMFGHQDDLAYGVHWKTSDGKRSDIKDVLGDYPAVYGWDLGKIEYKSEKNLDGVPFIKIKQYIKDVYDRGGINTISWHVDNPVTLKSAWDNTNAISSVLPNGRNHKKFTNWLDNAAEFLKSLKGSDGKLVPIIFRPYHELNGGWFWWGAKSCTVKEYIALWKYTLHYLRDKKKVHNLIYCFNTNDVKNVAEFVERYPGNDYVDMVSFDMYQQSKNNSSAQDLVNAGKAFKTNLKSTLTVMDSVAKQNNKIPALAETGLEAIPDLNWWTSILGEVIKDFKISYVLVWRNHGWQEKEGKMHYYAPFTGQTSAPDFIKFYKLPTTIFGKELAEQNIYKK